MMLNAVICGGESKGERHRWAIARLCHLQRLRTAQEQHVLLRDLAVLLWETDITFLATAVTNSLTRCGCRGLMRRSNEIGWEERLRYDLFSVELDVNLHLRQTLTQSVNTIYQGVVSVKLHGESVA